MHSSRSHDAVIRVYDDAQYVTRLVRLRERLIRADTEALDAIDAEVIRHPMPADAAPPDLAKRLIGRWQSPRRPYFYHANEIRVHPANEPPVPPLTVAQLVLVRAREFWQGAL